MPQMLANQANQRVGNYRWVICTLLFVATTVNYVDRQILALVKEFLDKQFGWSDFQFGLVNALFQGAYGIGLLWFGWFVDKRGVRVGYAVSMVGWSVAAIAHGLVALLPMTGLHVWFIRLQYSGLAVGGFGFCRILLGLAEAGNFPSAIKGVAQWFPKRERAFATSIFNSGTNVGAILAPAIVPILAYKFGWPMPFIVAGLLGFAWLFFWLPMYNTPEHHKGVGAAELQYIRSDNDSQAKSAGLPWGSLLKYPQAWSFITSKFLTDPVWWFFLVWLPDFFNATLLLNIKKSWVHLVTIYAIITVLSIMGSWMTGYLAQRGWSVTRARKSTMFIFALCVVPVFFTTRFIRFNADAHFFQQIKGLSYKEQIAKTVDGKEIKQEVTKTITDAEIARMQPMAGKSFRSNDQFFAAVSEYFPPGAVGSMKQGLADAARDNRLFWIAILLIGLAGAAHQAWSANLFTTVSDMFPKQAVGSVVGLGGMAGSLGGMAFPIVTGILLDRFKANGNVTAGYTLLFSVCAFAYLVAFVINHLLAPRYEQIQLPLETQ